MIFDYAIPTTSPDVLQRAAFKILAARVNAVGEPWQTFFVPEDLMRELGAVGFSDVEDLSGDVLDERYFAGRQEKLRVGPLGHILKALRPSPRNAT